MVTKNGTIFDESMRITGIGARKVIVFTYFRFHPSTRVMGKRSFLTRSAFLKRCVFGHRFHWIRVKGRPNRKKISVFKTKLTPVNGA